MKYCTNCGNENYNNRCRSCGVKINQTHRYCGWCAEELSFDDKVCPYCNTKIKPGILSNFLGVIAFLMIPIAIVFLLGVDIRDKLNGFRILLASFTLMPFVSNWIYINIRKKLSRFFLIMLQVGLALFLAVGIPYLL